MPSFSWAQCEREDTGDARAAGLMERQVGVWRGRWERRVADASVEWQARAWSGRQEHGVAGESVK